MSVGGSWAVRLVMQGAVMQDLRRTIIATMLCLCITLVLCRVPLVALRPSARYLPLGRLHVGMWSLPGKATVYVQAILCAPVSLYSLLSSKFMHGLTKGDRFLVLRSVRLPSHRPYSISRYCFLISCWSPRPCMLSHSSGQLLRSCAVLSRRIIKG